MRRIQLHQPNKRLLVYGHFPASHHNLKQLELRYCPATIETVASLHPADFKLGSQTLAPRSIGLNQLSA